MKLKAKVLPIATGDILVVVLCENDASLLDLHPADRIELRYKRKKIIATVDIAPRVNHVHGKYKQHILHSGQIGIFAEVQTALGTRDGFFIELHSAKKPESLTFIRKRLDGHVLNSSEIHSIVKDIAEGNLSSVEITYFVVSSYIHELNIEEVQALTYAMVASGQQLKLLSSVIVDKHCIGGVAANRTSTIVVPILAALGLVVPKTSSRSITSAAGTADTMEVLCPVNLTLSKMKRVIKKTGACLVWGGSMSLAPADDKIIQVEHPLSIDPTGQLLASILAKKKSVSATHVFIDIPIGRGAKITTKKHGTVLKKRFEELGKLLGMKLKVRLTDGTEPIGNGIGPALEARDILWTLQNSSKGSDLLRKKSLRIASDLLELTGKAKKGKGRALASHILDSGKAYKKFIEIIKAQGGKEIAPENIRLAHRQYDVVAGKSGTITHIDNVVMNKIARIAGAPHDQEAGVYLYYHKGSHIKKGEKLFTIYSDSVERLRYARHTCKKWNGVEIA